LPRKKSRQRKVIRWIVRPIIAVAVLILGVLGWAALTRHLAPTSNTALTRFDAIIVLGTPADRDGNPTPAQLARVTEAVHEYEQGVAPRLIFSGGVTDRNGATHTDWVEGLVMAHAAEAQGIPESAIFVEGEAMDTIQNACYSVRIMKAHGWHSAEVVSAAAHLPRAAIIFSHLPIEWRTHAAPPMEPASATDDAVNEMMETLKTARYLAWARWTERCEP
jgi:uncharacterized SAM-binding protein YcdF (DUF218 family)